MTADRARTFLRRCNEPRRCQRAAQLLSRQDDKLLRRLSRVLRVQSRLIAAYRRGDIYEATLLAGLRDDLVRKSGI